MNGRSLRAIDLLHTDLLSPYCVAPLPNLQAIHGGLAICFDKDIRSYEGHPEKRKIRRPLLDTCPDGSFLVCAWCRNHSTIGRADEPRYKGRCRVACRGGRQPARAVLPRVAQPTRPVQHLSSAFVAVEQVFVSAALGIGCSFLMPRLEQNEFYIL
jgi:hypothetical protein